MKDYNNQIDQKEVVVVIKGFKGYYFKCSTEEETIAFILAIHCDGKEKTVSLQVITESGVYHIPFENMMFHKNIFSLKGIRLDIQTDDVQIKGRVKFSDGKDIKGNIMGPFAYLPFMQCRHQIFRMKHQINGKMAINGKQYLFSNGTGYIEGDSGRSFPKQYAWTQCHHEDISLMLAVADIPLLGVHFIGVIGVIHIYGYEYRLATYLGAKASYIGNDTIVVKQGRYRFMATLIDQNNQLLFAPQKGKMERTIRESVRCTARYRFEWDDKEMFDFRSDRASFEYEFD